MSRPRIRHVAVYSAVAFGLSALAGGCAHHKAPAAAPAPAPVAAAPAASQATPVTPVVDEGAGKRALAALRSTLTQMMFFDFDRAELTSEDRATLDAKIPILQANAGLRIRVDGNCDDRGSDEYNLALGQRRAAAAKRYLTDHGIDASRIEIVSYGREHPVAQGNDEASWAKNRNDQFEIVAGADQMHAGQ